MGGWGIEDREGGEGERGCLGKSNDHPIVHSKIYKNIFTRSIIFIHRFSDQTVSHDLGNNMNHTQRLMARGHCRRALLSHQQKIGNFSL